MPGISEDDIRRVREASDLVAIAGERVQLRQRGRDFWGCCPFHNEKSPSFKIDPTTQLWHCFGCGEGGDVFSFVMKIDDLGFVDAVRELARRAGIQISEAPGERISRGKKARLKEVCEATAEFYHTQLMRGRGDQVDAARSYLSSRKLGGDVPKRWNLGYAPGRESLIYRLRSLGFTPQEMIDANVALPSKRDGRLRDRFYDRIMFPIRDAEGDTIAFGGRVVGKGEPKYLNSQETPVFHKSEVLFGLDMAKATMAATGVAIVVEGYTDVIVLHEAGVKNAVATLGTALTLRHIRALSRHAKNRIVYLFDGDEAGQRAADRAARFVDESMLPEAGRSRVELYAVTLPDDLDPADFVQQRGADALQELLEHAVPLLRYAIDRTLSRHDLSDFADRSRALPECLSLLAAIKQSVLAQEYAGYIADRLQMDTQTVVERLAATPAPRSMQDREEEPATPMPQQQTAVQLSPRERERLRIEREFLSLCAREPQLGMGYAAVLAQTQWRRSAHADIAAALLAYLSENAQASAGDVVRGVEELRPGSASTLTFASTYDDFEPAEVAQFLAEELAIRDMEDSVVALNVQLKDPSSMSQEDYDLTYAAVVSMQKDLTALRREHKPLGAIN
ncbi:DNA primase [uncultured Slackia sp.]|uniref:DNA primase n=1 Tax=uncultured Slackia sp. TaxID=665903 RepID=UPI0025E699F2|nr:DNA primase [uncultured Slackia sp.]